MPNLREIEKRLAEIEACKGDSEIAHNLEDKLLWDFVQAISTGKQRYITRAAEQIMRCHEVKQQSVLDEAISLLKECDSLLVQHHNASFASFEGCCPVCYKKGKEGYPNDIFGRIENFLRKA